MAAYRRVYDSRHLQADCQEPGSAREPYRVRATFVYKCAGVWLPGTVAEYFSTVAGL